MSLSFVEKVVEAISKLDDLKGLAEGIQDFLDAESAIDYAAATAKITAELAAGIAIGASVRTGFGALRLGLAVFRKNR